jgi:hypothetical protein
VPLRKGGCADAAMAVKHLRAARHACRLGTHLCWLWVTVRVIKGM